MSENGNLKNYSPSPVNGYKSIMINVFTKNKIHQHFFGSSVASGAIVKKSASIFALQPTISPRRIVYH
jgi:hypothetical protein